MTADSFRGGPCLNFGWPKTREWPLSGEMAAKEGSFPLNNGSMRCRQWLVGGRLPRWSYRCWFSVGSWVLCSCFTAFEPSISSLRCVCIFIQSKPSQGKTNWQNQYWRILTTFLYFGPLNLDLLFHVFFLQRYSRLLEESSGSSPANFSWLLSYAMTSLILLSPFLSLPFLGTALSSSLVYIWSRRNPETRLSFLGILVFTAPYLPWVLIAFSLVVHGIVPKDEISGIVVGHIWYFFSDVYPSLHGGHRPLDPPAWWRRLFEAGGHGEGWTSGG